MSQSDSIEERIHTMDSVKVGVWLIIAGAFVVIFGSLFLILPLKVSIPLLLTLCVIYVVSQLR